MARYRLRAAAYFDAPIRVYKPFAQTLESVHLEEGAEIEFLGIPGEHMEPLDKAATMACEAAAAERAKWDQISMDAQRAAMMPQVPMTANLLPPSGR